MYTLYTAKEYQRLDGEPDYDGMIGIPVPTENIKDIRTSMFLMGIELYRIEKYGEVLFESDRLLEIIQCQSEKRAGN